MAEKPTKGTVVSFGNTPQAKDDQLTGMGTEDTGSIIYLDVMANDLAGKGKSLWSVDDGISAGGDRPVDLLTQDAVGVLNTTALGGELWITADGKIAYRITEALRTSLQSLAVGQTAIDSFTYAIQMGNGTLSWANVTFTIAGTNDAPVVQNVSINAVEDGPAVTGNFNGDDVDSDDDGNTLQYTLTAQPAVGTLSNNGDGSFTYNPGSNFQELAAGETSTQGFAYTATDKHGAVSAPAAGTITITGINDAPTLQAGAAGATEDGSTVTVDLAALGNDIDSDDDGNTLNYTLLGAPAAGSAVISGTTLSFNPGQDFQGLALGETQVITLNVEAKDGHGASAVNTVAVTVTGTNDAPTLASGGSVSVIEDGAASTLDLATLGADVDSDNDGSNLEYKLLTTPAQGTASIAGTVLTFNPDDDYQQLNQGMPVFVNVQVQATDTHGASVVNTVKLNVTGVNDAPTLKAGTLAAIEDGATVSLDLAPLGDDIDFENDGSNLKYSLFSGSALGLAAVSGTTFTFHPGADFQELAEGETQDLSFKVQATDNQGASAFNTVVVTVTGTNDAPQITGGDFTAAVNAMPAAFVPPSTTLDETGTLQFTDVDLSDTHTVTVGVAFGPFGPLSPLGSFNASIANDSTGTGAGTVAWQYSINNSAVAYLGAGESVTDSYLVNVDDGKGWVAYQQVDVTVHGVNDAPVITSGTDQAKGNTMEDTVLAVSGQVTISDLDNSDTHSWSIASNTSGDYGTATVDANGKWTYTVANGTNGVASPVQNLAQGDTVIETFTVRASDGKGGNADQIVHVVVAGINDAAVITPQSQTITETNAPQSTGGTLTLTDIDSPQSFKAQGSAGKYGNLVLGTDGTWTYAMNGAHDEFEQGKHYVDTFSVTAEDGTTLANAITVTIAGTNDAPTAVNDLGALQVTSLASQVNTTTVKWVDWTQASAGEVKGVIDLGGGQTIDVTYTGVYSFAQTSGGTDFYTTPATAPLDLNLGTGTYTSAGVANGPTGSDIIGLHIATTRTLTFSQPVDDLFFAVVSLNGNGYRFDQDFDILSYGRGYWGNGGAVKTALPDGRFELRSVANGYSQSELHGVLGIKGSVSSLTWDGLTDENWNGFTVGTYGKAQTAVATGNLLGNDTDPENNPLNVSTVNGQTIAGNSISLTLASGARLNVNKNGSYSYDENGAFVGLAAGETFGDTFTYVAQDSPGASSNTATASITVTGINDAPTVAQVDAFTFEDGGPVTAAFAGDDVDSDDNVGTLTYAITSQPPVGTVTNNGNGTFSYDPGTNFQALAKGDAEFMNFTYTATDSHGAVSAPATISIKVGGTNDAPTLNAGTMAAQEDGPAVAFNLAPLGNDVDNDNDGSNLVYALQAPSANASIAGTTLSFNPHNDFQSLAAGQTQQVLLNVSATDKHNASATNAVTVTVTGVNDAPVFTGGDTGGAVAASPGVAPFKVDQYNNYLSDNFALANIESHIAANAPSYSATASVIDYTDDPLGFAGDIPGSTPWPAAQQTGASGTDHALNDNFVVRISGQVSITTADTYTFRTVNDDGVYLRVNNQLIISDNSTHPEAAFTGSLALTPGVYPVELFFFENGGEASLEFSFRGSNGSFGHVTSGNLLDSGVLNFGDVDLADSHTVSAAPVGSNLGTLSAIRTADTTGSGNGGQVKWDYSVNNEAVRYLGEGDTRVESFTVTVNDGNGGTDTRQVDVSITGANDPATLGNAVVGLTETDVQQTVGGTLSISDVDQGEAFYTPQSGTAGALGSFSIDANGAWSYTTNDALDHLNEGQIVTEVFNVSSVDGSSTTVTVNITGTADGPTAVADSNSLSASTVVANNSNAVYWADWQSVELLGTNVNEDKLVRVTGTITLGDGHAITVTYEGLAWIVQLGQNQPAPGMLNYTSTTSEWIEPNSSALPYTSSQVNQGPQAWDIIGLNEAFTGGGFLSANPSRTDFSPRNLTFSEPVENLFFAVMSMNSNGYKFDQNFQIVSQGQGKYGDSPDITPTNFGGGQYGIVSQGEFHGVLKVDGSVEELSWTSQNKEAWNGFTVGTYGQSQSASASGNVLANDTPDAANPALEVSAVGDQAMVGLSVTLTLPSGATIKVDRDGDYFYDDTGSFAALGAGDSAVEYIEYTVRDNGGNTDTGTLAITINGVNDTAVLGNAVVNLTETDAVLSTGGTLSISDVDSGEAFFNVQSNTAGTYGKFSITANGAWSYNTNDALDFLVAGQQVSDVFNVTSIDGTATSVTVNITGTALNIVAGTNLARNGSFENLLTDWTELDDGVDRVLNTGWQAAEGSWSLDLNAFAPGGVEQVVATQSGTEYGVFFQMSKNYDGLGTIPSAAMRVTATANTHQDYSFAEANLPSDMLWRGETYTFTANSANTTLSFESLTLNPVNPAKGPALDDVVIVANTIVHGFSTGDGDVLNLSNLLTSIGAPHDTTAFFDGYLRFLPSGADTLVQVDPNGGADDYITALTLTGLWLNPAADGDNYIL